MSHSPLPQTFTDFRIAHLNYDGTSTVGIGSGIAPVGGVYTLTAGISANKITIAAGVRVRAANCIIRCDTLTMGANARLDANGNADGTTTGMNSAGGDLFCTVATGGAARTTTGAATAGIGSGGNAMGSSAGAALAAGVSAGVTTASSTISININRCAFRSPQFHSTLRTQGNTTLTLVTGGQGGVGGAVDISAGGTATGPAGGSAGQPLVIRARRLVMGAGARIESRGGDGTAASFTGAGIASGSSPGGSGWVQLLCDEVVLDPTATIDAFSGATGAGANGGGTSSLAPAGSAILWVRGSPRSARRVLFCGDSKTVGFGTTALVQVGSYRSWALDKKYYGNVPWQPVGGQLNGGFPNNEMCGASGEKVAEVAARLVVDAPAYIAPITGWPHPVVVIDIGTNDVTSGTPATATSVSQYSGMLDTIYAANPNAIVFVCSLVDNAVASAGITTWNTAARAMWTARAEWGVNLFEIDLRTAVGAYSVNTFVDNTHLNEVGVQLAATAIRAAWTLRSL